jgi:hypothetical protein
MMGDYGGEIAPSEKMSWDDGMEKKMRWVALVK